MEELKERELMSEEEYTLYIHNKVDEDFKKGIMHLHSFDGSRKFKSIRRAIKRGLVSPYGDVYPKRPFNNRSEGREVNDYKKKLYGELKDRQSF